MISPFHKGNLAHLRAPHFRGAALEQTNATAADTTMPTFNYYGVDVYVYNDPQHNDKKTFDKLMQDAGTNQDLIDRIQAAFLFIAQGSENWARTSLLPHVRKDCINKSLYTSSM
jgi:hypothetical protein